MTNDHSEPGRKRRERVARVVPARGATASVLQAKLKVNTPGDVHEQEADRAADAVMRAEMPEAEQAAGAAPVEEEEEAMPEAAAPAEGEVARQEMPEAAAPAADAPEEEEEEPAAAPAGGAEVARKAKSDAAFGDRDVSSTVQAGTRAGGQPMPDETRGFMESRFGHDFSRVRVHTNAEAAQSAEAVQAKAYTVGQDVVFGAGEFTPETTIGKRLIAHELAHVVQQGGAVQRDRARTRSAAPLSNAQLYERLNQSDQGTDWDATKANATIDGFADEKLKEQIAQDHRHNRAEFLAGMLQYFNNSLTQVVNHFSQVEHVPLQLASDIHLHHSASQRLVLVEAELARLGHIMPQTSVALGLRGRCKPHTRNSKGKMAHPLGYAIDYRARQNPMITDPRRVTLQQIGSGEEHTTMQLGHSFGVRRDLLSKMGKRSAADPNYQLTPQEQNFMKQYEQEFTRLSVASQRFVNQAPPGLAELSRLGTATAHIDKQLKKLRKRMGARSRPELSQQIETLEAEKHTVEARITELKSDIPALVKPWLDKITEAKTRTTDRERLKKLDELETALTTDTRFLFEGESDVKDPSAMQLAALGFFTPDEEAGEGERESPNQHGFDLLFMQTMLKYGFDQGIAWSATASDAMHFELVEGVNSIVA